MLNVTILIFFFVIKPFCQNNISDLSVCFFFNGKWEINKEKRNDELGYVKTGYSIKSKFPYLLQIKPIAKSDSSKVFFYLVKDNKLAFVFEQTIRKGTSLYTNVFKLGVENKFLLNITMIDNRSWGYGYVYDSKLSEFQSSCDIKGEIYQLSEKSNIFYSLYNIGCSGDAWQSDLLAWNGEYIQMLGDAKRNPCRNEYVKLYSLKKEESMFIEKKEIFGFEEPHRFLKSYWEDKSSLLLKE
jgi:hypothetical protein